MMIVWRKVKGKKWRAHSKVILQVERKKTQDWLRDFLSDPVVKNPRFHCKEHGSNPWSGNQDLAKLKTWPKEKKERVGLVSSTVGVPGLKEVLRG